MNQEKDKHTNPDSKKALTNAETHQHTNTKTDLKTDKANSHTREQKETH